MQDLEPKIFLIAPVLECNFSTLKPALSPLNHKSKTKKQTLEKLFKKQRKMFSNCEQSSLLLVCTGPWTSI